MKSCFILISALIFYASGTCFVNPPGFRPCPPLTPLGNLSNAHDLQLVVSDIILDLWQLRKPTLTQKGKDLKNVLLSMLGSSNLKWQDTAIGATFLIWIYIPQLSRNPSLCPYAEVIDANIKWLTNRNCDDLRPALIGVPSAFSIGARLVAASALENSECGNSTYKPPKECCPNGGKKFDIDALFNLIRDEYPPEFETVLRNICKSQKVQDDVICVSTAASTSDEFRQIIAEFNSEIRLTFFNMLLSPPLPKTCCSAFRKKLDHLLSIFDAESNRAGEATIINIGC